MTYASVISTVAGEPPARLQRMVDRLAAQTVGPLEVLIAAPPHDAATIKALRAHGAVASIVPVTNPTGRRETGLNRAIAAAACDVVCRVDARSLVAPDHVARCHARLASDPSVGVVGGRQHSVAVERGVMARGIARALANPWTTGGASYRRAGAAGEVDTVYLGSFRRDELVAVGGYDETLDANEDFDLCQRYRANGMRVWLEKDLVVDYEARADLGAVWRQYEAFGASKVRYWRAHGQQPNARQLIGLIGPAVGLLTFLGALRKGRGAAALVAGVGGLAVLDHVAVGGVPPLGERAVSVVASGLVPTAWAVGAYREYARTRSRARAATVAAPQANDSPP